MNLLVEAAVEDILEELSFIVSGERGIVAASYDWDMWLVTYVKYVKMAFLTY